MTFKIPHFHLAKIATLENNEDFKNFFVPLFRSRNKAMKKQEYQDLIDIDWFHNGVVKAFIASKGLLGINLAIGNDATHHAMLPRTTANGEAGGGEILAA